MIIRFKVKIKDIQKIFYDGFKLLDVIVDNDNVIFLLDAIDGAEQELVNADEFDKVINIGKLLGELNLLVIEKTIFEDPRLKEFKDKKKRKNRKKNKKRLYKSSKGAKVEKVDVDIDDAENEVDITQDMNFLGD